MKPDDSAESSPDPLLLSGSENIHQIHMALPFLKQAYSIRVGQGIVAEMSLKQFGRPLPGYTLTSDQLLKQEYNTILFVLVARLLRLWSSLDKEGG